MKKLMTTTAVAAVAATIGIGASPIGQGDTTRTRGDFAALPGAPAEYETAEGWAQLIRVGNAGSGSTRVQVRIDGLEPSTDFPAHLHTGSCADLGGHYMDDPEGPNEPPNELWPAFTTRDFGRGQAQASANWYAEDPEGLSVVVHHHTAGEDGKKAKVLCADV